MFKEEDRVSRGGEREILTLVGESSALQFGLFNDGTDVRSSGEERVMSASDVAVVAGVRSWERRDDWDVDCIEVEAGEGETKERGDRG